MRTNLLLSRFSKCSYAVKLVLFKAYSSTVLAGAPAVQLNRLQSVLNAAARLVFSARKYEHTSPLLRELHWLSATAHPVPVVCVDVSLSSRISTELPC